MDSVLEAELSQPGGLEGHLARRNHTRVLVVSNCQTFGLAGCMNNIGVGVQADGLIVHEAVGKTPAQAEALMAEYTHVFALPMVAQEWAGLAGGEKLRTIPTVYFDAYHPDLIYVGHAGGPVASPMGGYHSALALGAFHHGMSVAQTLALFNARTYRALGYLDAWEQARAPLVAVFRGLGMGALEAHFPRWCAPGSFMLTVNHPRLRVLSSIAAEALRGAGLEMAHEEAEIADTMMNGPVYPVYPEVGEAYGVAGSYRFKLPGSNHALGLDEVVALSFETYRGLDLERLTLARIYRDKLDAAIKLLA